MIVIRETDNTQSPVREYTNFTVLVPGYWDQNKDDPFIEEIAIEFTSQADFVAKIGKVGVETEPVAAVPCTLAELSFIPIEGEPVTERTLPKGSTFYKKSAEPVEQDINKGRYLVDNAGYHYAPFISDGIGIIKESDNDIYVASAEADPGYSYPNITWSNITVGQNAITKASFGNQFAYELLGLGYTVLYADLVTLEETYSNYIFEPFEDKAAYDFRYILNGFVDGTYNKDAYTLANNRQDCTALCDLDALTSDGYNNPSLSTIGAKVKQIKTLAVAAGSDGASKYVALFANRPTYKMTPDQAYKNNVTFAAGFHYLACAAKALENFAEWYAVAGYTRGVSPYAIDKLDINLGDAAVELLQGRNSFGDKSSRCVNILIKVRGQYYLWGNRTAELLTAEADKEQDTLKASHFLNVRQLCTTIKKQLYVSCRSLTFDPNSDVLWLNFKGRITPTLDRAKGDQGLKDYKISKVIDDRKAALTAKIRIVPIEAVEDFFLDLILEDSISGEIEINESEN